MAGTFAGFEPFQLSGVQITEEEFGRGSYAVVLKLEYRGLTCAGKKLYPVLYEQGVGDIIHRFESECRLLAHIRHPNIVQFIGVYFEEGSRVPILVMEFLPTTLARCIDTYGVLPEEISYSILYGVALGLYHLHSETPAIVHRDLSANNVLLTSNMKAKISDLGVARILNLTPQQMSRMTRAPGTPAYMPPEAMRPNPMYDSRIDEFAYGILMIHVLSGKWPLPLCEAARINPKNRSQLLPVSEAERRDEYLQEIGNAHPLMDLILRCVSNDPEQRARAAEIVQRMERMIHQSPPTFANQIEMFQRVSADASEKEALRKEKERLEVEVEHIKEAREVQLRHKNEAELERVRTDMTTELNAQSTAIVGELREGNNRLERLAQHCQEDMERSKLAHSIATEQSQLQLSQLETQHKAVQNMLSATVKSHQAHLRTEGEERMTIRNELERLRLEVTRVRSANRNLQAAVAAKDKSIQSKDREILSKKAEVSAKEEEVAALTEMQSEMERLQAVVYSKDKEIDLKEREIQSASLELSLKEKQIATKDATITLKESELASKNAVLKCQSSTIQGLNIQLANAQDFMFGQKTQPHPLHSQAKITWEPCSDLPERMSNGQTVIIKDKIYFGGGVAEDDCVVLRYSPSKDAWTTLPACPVRWFGLGQFDGKLITVGGRKKSDHLVTNEVYQFNAASLTWKRKRSIPVMPTARWSPAVLSYKSSLIAAGGNTGLTQRTRTTVVEVFKKETSHWYTTEPLPFCWENASSILINNTWYLLGGATEKTEHSNRAVCVDIDLLLQPSPPRGQASTDRHTSAWKCLPNTPLYASAAATFTSSLLAVGGSATSRQQPDVAYVYSPSTNTWLHIGTLSVGRVFTATASLSPTAFLVIGGRASLADSAHVNTAYKVLLQIN